MTSLELIPDNEITKVGPETVIKDGSYATQFINVNFQYIGNEYPNDLIFTRSILEPITYPKTGKVEATEGILIQAAQDWLEATYPNK